MAEVAVSPLRIGMVAPPWFEVPPTRYGGIEWLCYWLVEGLLARGHQVTLITSGRSHTMADTVTSYPEPPSERLGEFMPEVVHAAVAAEALSTVPVDLVHDHSVAGPLGARGRKVPTVVTVHGPVEGESERYLRALGATVCLVAISESQRRPAPDLPWRATVHNAIPVAQYPFVEEKEDFLLFLGRMSPDKGVHLAIEAAREAGRPLLVAGKCSEPSERLYFENTVKPRLGPGIEWLGQADVEMKKDLLSRARCLLLPLQWEEPFGLVMAEAQACGTPVVALARGSAPEVVRDGTTGVLCAKAEELPEAIERAGAISPHDCRKWAEQRFDVPRMVREYEAVYGGLVLGGERESKTPSQVGDVSSELLAG
jgi:glycosyltransferase involved in cell wall biosynthesis